MSNQAEEKALEDIAQEVFYQHEPDYAWPYVVQAVIAEWLRRNEGKAFIWYSEDEDVGQEDEDRIVIALTDEDKIPEREYVPLFLAPQSAALPSANEISEAITKVWLLFPFSSMFAAKAILELLKKNRVPVEQVNLPDRSALARIITQAGNPVDAAQAVLEFFEVFSAEYVPKEVKLPSVDEIAAVIYHNKDCAKAVLELLKEKNHANR